MNRRVFLRGVGGTLLTLPVLESILPRRFARAAGEGKALRFLAFYTPNGFVMNEWDPSQVGPNYTLSSMLSPLEGLRDKFSVYSGINNDAGKGFTAGHAPGTASFLTCHKVSEDDVSNSTSCDLLFADSVADQTPIHSLQLGTDDTSHPGGDSGMSQAYESRITWRGDDPLPKLTKPGVVFDLLFSELGAGGDVGQLELSHHLRTTVVDRVLDDANRLRAKLGTRDKVKLDEYLDSVQSLQKAIDDTLVASCDSGDPGAYVDDVPDFETEMSLLNALMVKAFECDRTRTISFMLNEAHSQREFGFLDAPGPHHEFTHNRYQEDVIDNRAARVTIESWMVEKFADLLYMMDDVVEEEGATLLDNSIVHFGNENGDGHSKNNVPVLLAGGGGGALTLGKHVRFDNARKAELFLSVLQTMGVDIDRYGDDGETPLPLE